jgi:hypothetical protein
VDLNLTELLRRDDTSSSWPAVPEVRTYEQLLDLHRQLIESMDRPGTNGAAVRNNAALIVAELMRMMRGAGRADEALPPEALALVPKMVEALFDGLRHDVGDLNTGPEARFYAASRWLDHIKAVAWAPQATVLANDQTRSQ